MDKMIYPLPEPIVPDYSKADMHKIQKIIYKHHYSWEGLTDYTEYDLESLLLTKKGYITYQKPILSDKVEEFKSKFAHFKGLGKRGEVLMLDGSRWEIEFYFDDGSVITDSASNCTPEGWDVLWELLAILE